MVSIIMKLQLHSSYDIQLAMAQYLRYKRKEKKLSRRRLAEISLVPEATIKKFELTGQISLRQLLLLWQILDDLDRLYALTHPEPPMPTSIEEVLRDNHPIRRVVMPRLPRSKQ